MKKLLSLLSVLTISGTAVPTTIAASPYQKEEDIKNNYVNYQQTNNLEKLNRNKKNLPPISTITKLDVPKIKQLLTYWCGPAIVESILRYFGLDTDTLLNNINRSSQTTYSSFQHYLGHLMGTITDPNLNSDLTLSNNLYNINMLGTAPNILRNVINNVINEHNLNNRNQYSIRSMSSLPPLNIDTMIRNSLINNTPAALAYRGNLPEYFTENSGIDNHFIIINGISGTHSASISRSTLRYNYIDPWTGQSGTFDHELLRLLISNRNNQGGELESYLIYYDPSLNEAQIQRPNQTEPMEIENCGGIIRQFVIENSFSSHCTITRSKRDYLNNNLSCPSASSPYYEYYGNNNEKNDYFRVWGKSGHDGIELKISLKTALAFENFFQQNQSLEIKNYLENLIKHVEQKNDTWSGGWILDTDRELMKNFIYDGYLKFHDKFLQLINAENRKKKNNSIFIRTWRTYNWANLSEEYQNSAFYISKNSNGNNY